MKSLYDNGSADSKEKRNVSEAYFNEKALRSRNEVLRKIFARQKAFGGTGAHMTSVKGYEGKELDILELYPENAPSDIPVLLYFHGGGFTAAPSTVHYYYGRQYAKEAGCRVLIPDYTLSLDAPFPAPLEDAAAAYEYALSLSPKTAVAGDSSGGCLGAAMGLYCRDRGLPVPCLQMLLYPVLDRRMETKSMEELADAFPWNAEANREMWKLYLKDYKGDKMYLASPAEAESLRGLPPAYIEAGEKDCLRDEALIFAERLKKDGVPADVHIIEGASHGYDNDIKTPLALKYTALRIEKLKEVFGK